MIDMGFLIGSGSRNDRWQCWSKELSMFWPIIWNAGKNHLEIRYLTREMCNELDQLNIVKNQGLQMSKDIFKSALMSTCARERSTEKKPCVEWCIMISQARFSLSHVDKQQAKK